MPDLTFHPLANIFPLLDGDAFDALVADVKAWGLNEPVVLHEGQILDGRNRYRACVAAGVDTRFEMFAGTDPLAFVISKNLHRRHLNESQRAMVARRLANLRHGGDRKSDQAAQLRGVSQQDAGRLLNVSERSVNNASVVQAKAAPELIAAVDHGEIPVRTAVQLVSLPKARQREIAAAGKGAATKAVKQMRLRRQASRGTALEAPPKETEHDRDLRYLRETWAATCESARAAFLRETGFQFKAIA